MRGADGTFRVLEDNVRTPSGMAYALVARQAVAAHLPYDGRWRNIRAELATYLRMVVAAGRPEPDEPGIAVMLSDGPSNSAWYEHRELAELAELRVTRLDELVTRGDRLLLRDGRRVQVVYRRTDEDRLRGPDGRLTAVGEALLPALRAGTASAGQRVRHRRGGRQARLSLRRRDGPLLPRRGAAGAVGARPTTCRTGARASRSSTGSTSSSSSRATGTAARGVIIGAGRRRRGAAPRPRGGRAGAPATTSPRSSSRLSTPSDRHRRATGAAPRRRATVRVLRRTTGPRLPGGLTRVALEEGALVVNSSRGGGGEGHVGAAELRRARLGDVVATTARRSRSASRRR